MLATSASADTISRLAFGSCAGEDEPQPIWEAVLREQPDVWVWAGDNIYGDTENMQELRDKYDLLLAQPGYQRLRETGIPILGTWDDHDYGANDAGAEFPQRAASQQIFLDFFGVPKDSPRRSREGGYHSKVYGEPGQRVQLIVLDTRYHRSPLRIYPRFSEQDQKVYWPDPDPEATLLGEAQWAWLQRELLKPAELRLIVSSIQIISSEHRFEKWMNLPNERRRFFDLLESTRAEGVVLLSGDRHHAELSRLHRPGAYPLTELTSSGINKSNPRTGAAALRPAEPNRYRLGQTFRGHHFGTVEVDWEQPDPLVRLSIINQEGERPIDTTFPLSTLSLGATPSGEWTSISNPARAAAEDPFVRIDGDLTDWDTPDLLAVDGEQLTLRFPTPEPLTLTRAPSSLHILLDFDGDDSGTDHVFEAGTDLEIVFSPRREPGQFGWRPTISGFDPEARELDSADMGLAAGPSHAASWFELRLSRARLAQTLPAAARGGQAGLVVYAEHQETREITLLAREAVTLPDVRRLDPAGKAAASLPQAPEGALRVVSLNTLWGSQMDTPEPFSRVLRALDADIYLFQEWARSRLSEGQVIDWFRTHVDPDIDWQAMVSGTAGSWSGTLMVSRHALRGRVPRMTPVDGGGWDFPARFAAAVVETPIGDVLAGSVHLKASGAVNTPEDERRFAEADAANRILIGMRSVSGAQYVVLGGDFNLLGNAGVVDRATRMLDEDGSPLTKVTAPVLGDEELVYTFGREGLRSRLDYIAVSDHSLRVANAFVLDTGILDRQSLRAMGVEAGDSAASDHLPVVVDLVPWRPAAQRTRP
ncbi:MAG: alkaline phosphatase D family protein [Pseudomonadota bacterium]